MADATGSTPAPGVITGALAGDSGSIGSGKICACLLKISDWPEPQGDLGEGADANARGGRAPIPNRASVFIRGCFSKIRNYAIGHLAGR